MVNWKRCGRKRSWPNLRYYPSICLEGLRETTKNLRINGLQAEMWTRDPSNTKKDCLPLDHDVRLLTVSLNKPQIIGASDCFVEVVYNRPFKAS
jgi:hypothetical protein